MSFTPMAIGKVRARAQDFTLPYYYEYTTIVYKKPDPSDKIYIYFKPFKLSVSIIIIVVDPRGRSRRSLLKGLDFYECFQKNLAMLLPTTNPGSAPAREQELCSKWLAIEIKAFAKKICWRGSGKRETPQILELKIPLLLMMYY